MSHIPNFLTHAKMQHLGRDSNYLYLDEEAHLELGSSKNGNIPGPTPLCEVKEKIEQYLNQWKNLDHSSRVNFGSNIEVINAKIRKRDDNFERTCSGSCLSYFGVGLLGEISDSQTSVQEKLDASRVSNSFPEKDAKASGSLNVQESFQERMGLLDRY